MSMRNLRGLNLKNQQSSLPGLLGTSAVRGGIGPGGIGGGADAVSGARI